MRGGQLRHKAYLQKPVALQSQSGSTTHTWTTVETVWVSEMEMRGAEKAELLRVETKLTGKWKLRYVDGVTGKCRVLVLGRESTLAAAVASTSATTFTVVDASLTAAKGDLLLVDSEIVEVASGEGATSLTVRRASQETTAATHTIGTEIRRVRVLNIDSPVNLGGRNREIELMVSEVR